MDHSHMDHGHMGHGDMDMGGGAHKCNMNMLFTWDTTDLCIVFRQWHIGSAFGLVVSLLAVAALAAGYELVRELTRRYEASVAAQQSAKTAGSPGIPSSDEHESSSLLSSGRGNWTARDEKRAKTVKAALYAVQVFYSFFIMLLFMTYNGWVMLAVAVGAFFGYLLFGGSSATKTVACH
ncbi:uncharacterized protein K452DRAFT_304555 [Aplosporella prunicola CBS 121167]|uniref:Copper transport protein n=1 Tax=Aplosporella prunicola CBS 121167 TaxID=1176127 RepID=A0A6A6BTK7_9PEZI|nr:uncharacterized protein K452DRAFT_304555 [Aplosporella prunicola CBS 121167]KAF2146605.1 hypothetical protein K452DRAFT_304555 [Aplosporella prunicola CBS 121167]